MTASAGASTGVARADARTPTRDPFSLGLSKAPWIGGALRLRAGRAEPARGARIFGVRSSARADSASGRRVPLLLFLLAAASCRKDEAAEPSGAPRAVKCAPVQRATVTETIEVRGTVAPLPERDAQLAPQVSGRLLSVEVREGDPVTQGQVVARVDDAPLIDATQQADAALARAKAEHLNAQTTLARAQRVFDRGIAARQEVDDATAREAAAKAAEAEAEAAARTAHRQLDRAAVRSPLRGVVLKVSRKPGELVDGTPATPVMEVADVSALELVADVPAQDLVRCARGAAATVTLPALPDESFAGAVTRVSPAVDRATGVGMVRIGIDRADGGIPPVGAFGQARVETGRSHAATLVPAAALRSVIGAEGEVVVCGPDHLAHVKRVRPGPARGGLVEVVGDLSEVDAVAVDPVLGLSEGAALEVAP